VVSIADDTTGLPHKVRLGHFQTKADAQRAAESYEARESGASYVVRETGTSLGVPAQPAVAAAPPAQHGSAVGFPRNFLEQAVPEASFGNLLGGRTYLEINPAFSYRLQYEDNIDYDTSEKLSDWSNVYLPEIKASLVGPRFSMDSEVRLWITEYINERDYNNVDQEYLLTMGYAPNDRLETSGGIGYSLYNNTDRFFETGVGGGSVENIDRFKEESKIFSGGFSYALTTRSAFMLNGFFTQYTVDDANDDNNFFGGTAKYSYAYSPRTQLNLGANYFHYDFNSPGDTLFFSDEAYELNNFSISGGFDHTVDRDLSFGAKAGMRLSENDSKTTTGEKKSGDGNGWVASFNIQKRVQDFDFEFEASRDITVNSTGGNYESTKFMSTNIYNITRRLNAQLQLQYWISRSNGDEFSGNNEWDLYFIGSSLNYNMYRWLQLSLSHYYRHTDYSSPDKSIHSNIVYFQMRFTPLRPLVIR
jgi:hypothetical protein